jgi:hypothetical protein
LDNGLVVASSIIAATSEGGTMAEADGQADLFVINADGTDIRPFCKSPFWDSALDWGTGELSRFRNPTGEES